MRTPIIAANWKMYKTVGQAVHMVQDLEYKIEDVKGVEVVICPPFIALKSIATVIELDHLDIRLGAQNMHWEKEGAYTGEVSPSMLKDLNVTYVIIGHSERREYFNETDEIVNKKLKAVFEHQLIPIFCVGESLSEREAGKTQEKIGTQIKKGLEGLTSEEVSKIVIAYEPIWAIGTGRSSTPEDANDVTRYIRATIGAIYSPEVAQSVRIQYGGSVKPENISLFMSEPDIDGALVGGASLEAESFAKIIKFERKVVESKS
jgi:triosephosphate isomerase